MKKIVSLLFAAGMATAMMAVPAKRGGIVRTMEDGTQKTVYLHGNEDFHYLTDAEGNWLDDKTLMPLSEEIKNERLNIQKADNGRYQVARRIKAETGTSRLLAPRGAVILVSFKDLDFESSNANMTEWAMGENYTYNGATGSIRQYFLDQSYGEYDMQIDIFGPVKVSKNMAYYGENDMGGNDKYPDKLVKEACILAHDSCGADFSVYDHNNDGKVDWVVILYAGYGEASGAPANTIWPHQYELSYTGMAFYLDGKKVDHYCCLNEKEYTTKKRDGIGTFCHEFGHVMGLPDLYATDASTHHTLCDWDIMDYGPYNNNGNTPPDYSAYERWFMGWITPRVLTDPEYVTLNPLHDTKEALLMCEGDEHNLDGVKPEPTEFYLIENRKKEGWDKYLPGPGMLLTKIKYSASKWASNTVNNVKSNMGVDLIEAKTNTTSGYNAKGKATDAFPRGATSYELFVDHEITDIELENDIIRFSYLGAEPQDVESVADNAAGTHKVIRDGKVLIIRDGKTYDILGNRL